MELLERAQFYGAKRIANKRDRFCWAVFLLLLFMSALATLMSAIWRYHSNPTFVVRLGSTQPNTPFPSVLICPEVMYPEEKVGAFVRDLKLPKGLNKTWLKDNMYLLAAFYSPDVSYTLRDLEALENFLEYNKLDLESVTRNLTPTCEESVIRCRWRQKMVKCNHLFKLELTTYGYCCVFNGRSLQREMDADGIPQNETEKRWIDSSVGFTNGLMVAINQSQKWLDDVDLTYKWVTIQLGQQFVECSYNGTPIAPGTEQWLGFRMEKLRIDEDARRLSYSLRKCRFSYEPLQYFPIYTKPYCIMECAMHRSLRKCKCLQMTYPRPKGVPYCRAKKLRCARGAAVPFGSAKCECPMSCDRESDFTMIQNYDLGSRTEPFDSFYEDLNLRKISIIRVFIPTHKLNTFSRRSVFDSISLFSQLGGVFSVFFGCSILTLLELGQLFYRSIAKSMAAKYWQKKKTVPSTFYGKKVVTFIDKGKKNFKQKKRTKLLNKRFL